MTGIPSVTDVVEIKKQRRRLAVDDFHPKWRNMYTSLHSVPLSGGKFNAQWKALETGMGFFDTTFEEGERSQEGPSRPMSESLSKAYRKKLTDDMTMEPYSDSDGDFEEIGQADFDQCRQQ